MIPEIDFNTIFGLKIPLLNSLDFLKMLKVSHDYQENKIHSSCSYIGQRYKKNVA